MALFRGPKSAISLLRAGASKHKPLIWLLLCRPTFLATENKKNVGRHFLGEDFVDVTRRGRLSPDATNLGTCGRHGDAAQTATLPWRGMSHYLGLKAVRQGGLRRPQVAFRPRTTDDWQQTTEHRRSDGDYGLALPKKSTRTNYAVYLQYKPVYGIRKRILSVFWDRPKSQSLNLTMVVSSCEGLAFCLGFGLRECRCHLWLEQAPEVVAPRFEA